MKCFRNHIIGKSYAWPLSRWDFDNLVFEVEALQKENKKLREETNLYPYDEGIE